MTDNNITEVTANEVTASTSAIWQNHIAIADTPEGFTLRTTYPANPDGVEVMLERWLAGDHTTNNDLRTAAS